MTGKEKSKKSTDRLSYATRAMIAELERYDKLHPKQCVTKKRINPAVIRYAARLMDQELDATWDEEALVPPDEKYLMGHMGDIRELASDKYKKYILWNPPNQKGIRIGTFQEFQDIPCSKLVEIANGIRKTTDKLGHIINSQGGTTVGFEIKEKQIGPGSDDPTN
jgi:hypothetical protein